MMLHIACLYMLLASPIHSTREYAERELLHRVAGWPGYYGEQVVAWSRTTRSPERSFRLRRMVLAYRSWQASVYQPPTPVWPCCDFYAGADGLRDRSGGYPWHAAARGMEGRNAGPHWHQWRRGTEMMARSMVRRGMTKDEVDSLMLAMWKLELETDCDNTASKEVMLSWSWEGGYP